MDDRFDRLWPSGRLLGAPTKQLKPQLARGRESGGRLSSRQVVHLAIIERYNVGCLSSGCLCGENHSNGICSTIGKGDNMARVAALLIEKNKQYM